MSIGLKSKVSNGLRWASLDIFLSKVLVIFSSIILTRTLIPSDFAIYAIALAVVGMANLFTFTGFHSAYIQKQNPGKNDLNIIWTVELIKNFILWLVVYNSSYLIGVVLSSVEAIPVIKAISFIFLLQGLQNIGLLVYRKELNLKKQFIFNFFTNTATTIVSIIFVLYFKNVWAMVYAYLIGGAIRLLLSYALHPFRAKLMIDFSYGKWVLVSVVVGFFKTHGVTLFVGRAFGLDVLGFFNRSTTFSINIFSQFDKIFSKIVFPSLSKAKDNECFIHKILLNTLSSAMFIISILIGFLYTFSHEFVTIILGERWSEIIPYLKVMLFVSFSQLLLGTFRSLLLALGCPKINTQSDLIIVATIVVSSIVSIIFDQLLFLLYGMVIGNVLSLLYFLTTIPALLNISSLKLLQAIFPSFLMLMAMVIFSHVFSLGYLSGDFFTIAIKLSLLLFVFIVVFLFSEKHLNLEFYKMLDILFKNKKHSEKYINFMNKIHIYRNP